MIYRSKHLPWYTFLVGLLFLSVSFNYLLYTKIKTLNSYISCVNPWMSVEQFISIQQEIHSLENERYKIIPKGE
jgi:hypothetical protein